MQMFGTLSPTARQNWSTWTAPSCFRKFMKRNRRSCCSLISFNSSFSTWWKGRGGADLPRGCNGSSGRNLETLTDGFLLRASEYFCRKGTKAEVGSVASSGWRRIQVLQHYCSFKPTGICALLSGFRPNLQASCPLISKVNDWRCPESMAEQSKKTHRCALIKMHFIKVNSKSACIRGGVCPDKLPGCQEQQPITIPGSKKWPECVYTHRISQVVQWRKKDRTSQDFSYQESKRSKRSEEIKQQEMSVILIYTYGQNSSQRGDDEGGGERWRFMSHTDNK